MGRGQILRAGHDPCSKAVFWKYGSTLRVLRPFKRFRIARGNLERATAGIIVSATRPEVITAAISGWQANESRGQNVLDNVKYMKLVQYFTSILQFELPRSCRDNNGPALPEHGGRFYACHVEKKLAVFWLIAALKAVLGTTDLRRARELKGAEIPEAWRSASIFLDHSPCVNCWAFLDKIKRATGLEIYVETRPFLVQGNREGATGCDKCLCDRCRRRFGGETGPEGATTGSKEPSAEMEAESGISDEEDASGLGPEADPGFDVRIGDGIERNGGDKSLPQSPTERGQETGPTPTRTPNKWRRFFDVKTGRHYGKPVSRPTEVT